MRYEFLGTGTSTGVPVVGCNCAVCTSMDPRDYRLRSSLLVEWDGLKILIDAGPDFRGQALRAGLKKVDHLLITHSHADHVNGLDDLRPISFLNPIPVWTGTATLSALGSRFSYMFGKNTGPSSRPEFRFQEITGPIHLGEGKTVIPIVIHHGPQDIFGFRLGDLAYLTDCSGIPGESMKLLEGVKHIIVGALRPKPHPTHFSFTQAIEAVRPLGAEKVWLTHLSHEVSHTQTETLLPEGFCAAWDGLSVQIP